MTRCSRYVRAGIAAAALAGTFALAGCETDGTDVSARALKPLSPAMLAELESKNMAKESPVVVRLFKEESELEIWKQDRTGHFALLKTYPICRWSGELGPMTKEGDRQAPEGFYTITQGQMNPNSHYYLSFDIGYPNAFDRAYGRTGSNLMVHGDCSSRGCYAMTDEQISEIYALARESFFGGQRSFQVQAYPFHMTAMNMARHRNNPNMPFWRMLKEGSDHFEVSRLEPKVDVCEKRYVFDAEAGASTPLNFDPTGRCPAYRVREDIAAAVKEKERRDETAMADLVSRGTPTVPVRTGADGGTNTAFLATYHPRTVREADGTIHTVVERRAPSIFPLLSNPLGDGAGSGTTATVAANAPAAQPPAAAAPATAQAGGDKVGVAAADAKPAQPQAGTGQQAGTQETGSQETGNLFTRLYRMVRSDDKKPAPAAGAQAAAASKPAERPGQAVASRVKPRAEPKSRPEQEASRQAKATGQPAAPQASASAQQAQTVSPPRVATTTDTTGITLPGAQPVLPAGSFDSRWSAVR